MPYQLFSCFCFSFSISRCCYYYYYCCRRRRRSFFLWTINRKTDSVHVVIVNVCISTDDTTLLWAHFMPFSIFGTVWLTKRVSKPWDSIVFIYLLHRLCILILYFCVCVICRQLLLLLFLLCSFLFTPVFWWFEVGEQMNVKRINA